MAGAGGAEWESPEYEASLPVTEKSNPLTRDLDQASANDIVRMLEACDGQIFHDGESGGAYQRLLSEPVVVALTEVAKRVELILKDPKDSLVVLSGCGTSGWMAFLISSAFNRLLKETNQPCVYSYTIAGGDRALLSSQEAPEDDAALGTLSLKQACEGKRRVLFIGISCGLSAPFVAGQLDWCLQRPDVFTPVLVGFNPADQARDEAVAGCSFTFLDVVRRMQRSHEAFIVNPAVGPEAVSGSSRMKGGSATKVILEVALAAAHAAAFAHVPVTRRGIGEHLGAYRKCLEATYAQRRGIGSLLEAAGQSLRSNRRVCYLGWGSLGVMGLIDASECNLTFGADYNDVRGFVRGGYEELGNNEGPLTSLGPNFCVSHQDFLRLVLPSLCDGDAVLLLYTHSDDLEEVAATASSVREKTSNLHAICHQVDGGDTAAAASLDMINKLCLTSLTIRWPPPSSGNLQCMQWELSTKLVLNAVSTGAHVLKGKVYQNHMIDVQVTNSKLYHRAQRLLQKLSGRPEAHCEESLLKAVYRREQLTADVSSLDITAHALAATHRSKVVPLALVCLLVGCSLAEAESHLERHPAVRDAVAACLRV
ncbi:glucokinase regulatory protein isoform X1 [Nelusetta ayraudi]|uniref:glucokinase regulatory protein isoform X1 n=1 Tax=Nelusetta ayraudi TaxID=303726 RepID=UPI003F70E80F